jgi:hypothetical protein
VKDKYTLDTDAAVWELVSDLKGEGWYPTLGFGKDQKQPEADPIWRCKATDPEKVKASLNFNSTDIVVCREGEITVFEATKYEQLAAIFGGGA